MKKLFLVLILLVAFCALPVYAFGGSNENKENNENKQTKETDKTTTALEAKEKRVTIRTQSKELIQLRTELRTKLAQQKAIIDEYREKTELTLEERNYIKSMITAMKTVKVKLGMAYQNANQSLKEFRGDKSTDKLTGLDLVIASQQARIKYLQEAIDTLSNI